MDEVLPHAIQMEASINEWEQVGEVEKALAFKKSTAGNALKNANQALTAIRPALANTDNNNGLAAERATFHDFVVAYCHLVGHSEDRYNQREGLKHLTKPISIAVQQWLNLLNEKNDMMPYLLGTGDKHNDEEMKRIFFKSMPNKWQDEFTSNGNNDISTATVATILKFMKQQEATS